MNKNQLIISGVSFGFLLLVASFLVGNYLGGERIAETQTDNSPIQNNSELLDNEVIVEEETINNILVSEAAEKIEKGMTYQEVVETMGRLPDTVVTDEIRKELGEQTIDYREIGINEEIHFEWRNDKPGCLPVNVYFNLPSMKSVSGASANACFPNAPTEPFGKPCSETNLCDLAVNTRDNF